MVLLGLALPGLFTSSVGPDQPAEIQGDTPPRTSLGLEPTSPGERARIRRRARLDLNQADVRRLIQLPGIGPSTARRIVEVRAEKGGFDRPEGLKDVRGIGARTLEELRPRIRVDGSPSGEGGDEARTVPLNRADRSALQKLPGIGPVLADRILRYRRRRGSFGTLEELKKVSGIGPATLSELRPHLRVSGDTGGR